MNHVSCIVSPVEKVSYSQYIGFHRNIWEGKVFIQNSFLLKGILPNCTSRYVCNRTKIMRKKKKGREKKKKKTHQTVDASEKSM